MNKHKVNRHRNFERKKKQATENHNTVTALERSVINYWGGGGGGGALTSFTGAISPSDSEVVQNI